MSQPKLSFYFSPRDTPSSLGRVETIKIGARTVGASEPCYIIAEAGVNHNGDLRIAKQLVQQARDACADCVKFQTFKAERVVTQRAPKAAYQLRVTDPQESQLAMLQKLELSRADHLELLAECRRVGIAFLSTPYSVEDARMLFELGVDAFKIASGQLVELPLLEEIARFGKPLILSTGMATMAEVCEAVDCIEGTGNRQVVVLQCTTNYPSDVADANLRVMQSLYSATGAIVGYSDHTEGITCCVAAAALGAAVIEKHFTLDRAMPGPDHKCSSAPDEFAQLVRQVRVVSAALGDGRKQPTEAERKNTPGMRRSIVAARLIPRGTVTVASDFTFKRPATGMPPKRLHDLVGRTAARELQPDEPVHYSDFA